MSTEKMCSCGGRVFDLAPKLDAPEKKDPRFVPADQVKWSDCVFYPFRGQGPWVLGVGILWILILEFVRFPVWLILPGYLMAYFKKMVSFSADGHREVPDWPDFVTIADDILLPFIQVFGCAVVCFGPMTYFFLESQIFLALLLGLIGSVYFPIGLLSVIMHDRFLSLFNLHILVPAIIKKSREYALVVGAMVIALVFLLFIPNWISHVIPLIGSLISRLLSYYIFVVFANMLGVFYFKNQEDLDWY